MNREEFNSCLSLLKGEHSSEEDKGFWFECLESYSLEIVKKAIGQINRENKELCIIDLTERCQLIKDTISGEIKEAMSTKGKIPYEFRSYINRPPIRVIENPSNRQIEESRIALAEVKEKIKNMNFRSMK